MRPWCPDLGLEAVNRDLSDRAFWRKFGDDLADSMGVGVLNARAQVALAGDHPFPEVALAQLLRSDAEIDRETRQMLADALDARNLRDAPVVNLSASSDDPHWRESKRYWKRRAHLDVYQSFRASGLSQEAFLNHRAKETGISITPATMKNIMAWGSAFDEWLSDNHAQLEGLHAGHEGADFLAFATMQFCEFAASEIADQRALEAWRRNRNGGASKF